MTIIQFKPRQSPTRQQALQWLRAHYWWPYSMTEDIGPDVFYGWRFVRVGEELVFANCIERGISEDEYLGIQSA